MIYIHTYEISLVGEKDFVQFYQYQANDMFVCESREIDLILLSPRRNLLNKMMTGAIIQQYKEDCGLTPSVKHSSTLSFDDDSIDIGQRYK